MSKRSMPSGGRSAKSALLLRAKRVTTAQNRLVGRDLSLVRLRSRRRRNQVTGGFLGMEVKYFDQARSAIQLPAPTTPDDTMIMNPNIPSSLNCLNSPSQGDGPSNRDGRKIRVRSIYIKGTVYRTQYEDQSGPGTGIQAYLACVLDRQCNGAAITVAQVFSNPSGAAVNNHALLRNLEYSDRYRILRDQLFNFDIKAQSGYALDKLSWPGQIRHFEWYIPCNILCEFNQTAPTASTVSSLVNNSISVVGAATNATAPDACGLTYNCRIRFTG